jgi:hypothetical protein
MLLPFNINPSRIHELDFILEKVNEYFFGWQEFQSRIA